MSGESAETRLKRLRMRSWRRGIRETDLILGAWADRSLAGLDAGTLDVYEAFLAENDHDILAWLTGRDAPPVRFANLVGRISGGAGSAENG